MSGFDDIPIACCVTPTLTTIRVPIATLGSAVLNALVRAVVAPQPRAEHAVVMPAELVVRCSCGVRLPSHPRPPACRWQACNKRTDCRADWWCSPNDGGSAGVY